MKTFERGNRVKINPELNPNILKHYANVGLLEAGEIYVVLGVYQYGGIKLVGFEKKFFHSDIFINV